MNQLKLIRDVDLGIDVPEPTEWVERKAARAIISDTDANVALLFSTTKNYHKLPGGGVEEGEEIIDAVRREVMEEIAWTIDDLRELGIIEEFRNKFALHQFSYCFIAKAVAAQGTPKFVELEIPEGFVTEWLPIDDAIAKLESEIDVEDYQGKFIQARDLTFLKEAKNLL